jgi:hypothetical protein
MLVATFGADAIDQLGVLAFLLESFSTDSDGVARDM